MFEDSRMLKEPYAEQLGINWPIPMSWFQMAMHHGKGIIEHINCALHSCFTT